MVEFKFNTAKSTYTATFYHEWEVKPDQVVSWEHAGKKDYGKYLKFDDGSNLYVMLRNATAKVVVTSGGMYRRYDLVHCPIPMNACTSPFGLNTQDIHPNVKPYTQGEHMAANQLIETGTTEYKVTRRIRMLTQEKIREAMEDLNVDEVELAKALAGSIRPDSKYWARGRNMQFALTQIMRLNGYDINKLEQESEEPALLASYITQRLPEAPGENRIISVRDIKSLLKFKTPEVIEKAEVVECRAETMSSQLL